jgi:carnitine 3-dehydrogenase
MTRFEKAAIIGGGVIGGGWAARFLLAGVDVALCDPDPDAKRKFETIMANAERAEARLWPNQARRRKGKLSFAASIAEACEGADLIQESAPERLELKQALHQDIGIAASAEAVIGSSTSGLLPSEIQAGTPRADRVLVAHPYNPVYLLPVVEIVGGKNTSGEAIAKAMTLYEAAGMKPIHLKKEIDAFVGDRLLEAMWRESLWLIKDGIATAETIDDVVRYGLGLRYAQMGQFMTYRLAGGEAGMRHFLEQFGPSLHWPWTKLMDVPEWNDDLIEMVAKQSDAQAQGKSIVELEEIRDNNLVDILIALRRNSWGAGAVLKNPPKEDIKADVIGGGKNKLMDNGLLETWSGQVNRDWTDYNGHMTEFRYLEVFSMATDEFLVWIGGGAAYVESGSSWYTIETHIRHIDEIAAGKMMRVETQIVQHDSKRIHLLHHLFSSEDSRLLATGEHMLMHVDMKARRSTPVPDDMKAHTDDIASRQSGLGWPEAAGVAIGIRQK